LDGESDGKSLFSKLKTLLQRMLNTLIMNGDDPIPHFWSHCTNERLRLPLRDEWSLVERKHCRDFGLACTRLWYVSALYAWLLVTLLLQQKSAEMRAKAMHIKRSKKRRDEDMDEEVLEDHEDLQARATLVIMRAIRSVPFSSSIWASHILNAVSIRHTLIAFMFAYKPSRASLPQTMSQRP
jgi:hypothetical protein